MQGEGINMLRFVDDIAITGESDNLHIMDEVLSKKCDLRINVNNTKVREKF